MLSKIRIPASKMCKISELFLCLTQIVCLSSSMKLANGHVVYAIIDFSDYLITMVFLVFFARVKEKAEIRLK